MDIRTAQSTDLSDLQKLVQQLGYSAESLKDLFALYSTEPSMGLWIAEEKEKVAGCLAFHVLRQFHDGALFRVVSLVVDSSFRRKGVGRSLMERAEKEARERGCEAVELTSSLWRDGSHEFYRRLGYLDSGDCGRRYFRKTF